MSNSSNTTQNFDTFEEALSKNLTVVLCGLFIFYVNGALVRIYFSAPSFSQEARYVLYIHLVLNDMLLVMFSVLLHVLAYQPGAIRVPLCYILVLASGTTFRNTPLILAGMAVERFVAVCLPLHHGHLCTADRARVFNAATWCVSSIPSLADLFLSLSERSLQFYISDILCYHANLFISPLHQVISAAGNGICMAFVWATLFYTYVHVLCAARAVSSKGQAQKAQRTILLHASQLLLCMLSYISPVFDRILISMFPLLPTKVLFGSFVVAHLLPRVLSPLIYGIRDKAFKKHLKGALLCQRGTSTIKVHV
ncbi:odorant receptor 131-2-like [Clupea harengus]|uniref:Odorant receptor 131-2-like n=1 Tax=Clupea harengus TaxID=7950 RepID=A0A6P3W5J6_CLUHA|nr:odorant receptor 131-2-like [Clupea harengus]